MSLVEVLVLFLSSAAVAAVVSGLFSLKTTRSLIAGQRQERREAAAERDREREEEAKRTDTAMFWARYVENGLETLASQLDRASQQTDLGYRRAKRNRATFRGLLDDTPATLQNIIDIRAAVEPIQTDPIVLSQAALLPFPGDFQQSALQLNRSLALADDFLQRYPWTRDEKIASVDRFLGEIKTTLAASARRFETSAVVVRQHEPMRYSEWFATTLADEKLKSIGGEIAVILEHLLTSHPDQAAPPPVSGEGAQ
jgi:hypothetical protein